MASGMTIALLIGALLMNFAVTETSGKSSRRWLIATLNAGIIFIYLQLHEWVNLLDVGLSFSTFPQSWRVAWSQASPIFGAAFFTITGFHLLHVLVAVLLLLWFIARIKNISQEKLKAFRLYWNFICVGWFLAFGFVYLLSIDTQGLLRR